MASSTRRRSPNGSSSPTLVQEETYNSKSKTKRSTSPWLLVGVIVAGFSLVLFSSRTSPTDAALNESYLRNEPVSGRKECTVWFAPSSLKGANFYGVYTTRDLQPGESILGRPDGVAIPVEGYRTRSKERKEWYRVWNEYWWMQNLPDHASYEAPYDIADFQIGFGIFPNHHCVKGTLHLRYPKQAPYDDSLVDRFTSPGAGAFSYNRGREFYVSPGLKAGEEIFLNYGYCDRSLDYHSEWVDRVIKDDDYQDAITLISNYEKKIPGGMDYDNGKLVVPNKTPANVVLLLPETKQDYDAFIKNARGRNRLEAVAQNSVTPRTPEWIQQHGICLENLVGRKSALPDAGQGGFAQFKIRQGDIVAGAPLLQIVDRNTLNQNETGAELLLNYCFGHKESTLLLCPQSNAVLINHCSNRQRQCGWRGPNAEVRWSSGWDPTSDAWRNMTLEEISKQPIRGLAFEIVALRDIYPGDEVFYDYGIEWEEAWAAHVAHYKPPPKIDNFITAKEANENDERPILEELVSGDLRKTVQHPYLFTGCQYWWTDQDDHGYYSDTSIGDWRKESDGHLLRRFADHGGQYSDGSTYTKHPDHSHWPCTVLFRQDNGLYTVRIHQSPFEGVTPWAKHKLPRFLTNYYRGSIRYFVKPYTSDQHLPGVFRHSIGIRNEMFPKHWKNLVNSSSASTV